MTAKGTPTPSVLVDTPSTSQGATPGPPKPSALAPSSSSGLTVNSLVALDTDITVKPGGLVIAVQFSITV